MSIIKTTSNFPSPSSSLFVAKTYYKPPRLSFSTRGRRRRYTTLRKTTPSTRLTIDSENTKIENPNLIKGASTDDENLKVVIDIKQVMCSSQEAFRDLQTFVTIDEDRRVIVSCRRSTMDFLGKLLICVCFMVSAFWGLRRKGLVSRNEQNIDRVVEYRFLLKHYRKT
ncbi:hypothetical protein ACFE04_016063 [Oxalis oulophora]